MCLDHNDKVYPSIALTTGDLNSPYLQPLPLGNRTGGRDSASLPTPPPISDDFAHSSHYIAQT